MAFHGMSSERGGEQQLCIKQQLDLWFGGPFWCPVFQFLLFLSVPLIQPCVSSQDFLRVLRDMLPASWLSQAPWEDNIVGILFFYTSHDFLWPDVDICIVLTSVRKRELLWSGSGKVLKKPWKLIGENMNICRAKRCLLSSLALWIFVRSLGVFHSTYKPDLLDLSADHASIKGGADLACFVVLEHLNICRRNKNGNKIVSFCSALLEMLCWEVTLVFNLE